MRSPSKRSGRDTEPNLTDFEKWGKRLRRAYKKAFEKEASSESVLRNRKRAINAFKLSAYRYYRQLQQAGLISALQEFVVGRDGSRWNGRGERGESWVLRLATKDEQTDKKRQSRRRLAAELRLANANNVQPDLLLGFLYEAGPGELIERDAKKEVKYEWAECYRAKAAPKRSPQRPKSKESRKPKDGWA